MTVLDLEANFAEIENDLITLSIMLKSPHSMDITLQIEGWMRSLNELGMLDIKNKIYSTTSTSLIEYICFPIEILLHLFERYQQTWTFLTKMFRESFSISKEDLVRKPFSSHAIK